MVQHYLIRTGEAYDLDLSQLIEAWLKYNFEHLMFNFKAWIWFFTRLLEDFILQGLQVRSQRLFQQCPVSIKATRQYPNKWWPWFLVSYGKGVRPQLVEADCFNNCINVYAYQCRVRPSDIQNIEQGMLPGGHHWGCTTGTRSYPSGHHNPSKDWLSLLKSKGTQSPEKREDPTQRQVTRRTVPKTTTSGTLNDLISTVCSQ